MPQLIEGGLCYPGQVAEGIGPHYPLHCPECGEESIRFGKAEDLGYSQEHHGEALTVVEVPVVCSECRRQFTIHLNDGLMTVEIAVTARK